MSGEIYRGQLFVISAPSGAGKSTLIRAILLERPELCFSVSSTTRPPREGETPGIDYHFISRQEFSDGIRRGRFVEWAEVHSQFYGTDGEQLDEWLQDGRDVLLDIDVQGARQVRCAYPLAHTIFVLPPSFEALEHRLKGRGTESPEQVANRLTAARQELLEAPWFDFVIVNDSLDEAIADFKAVLRACPCQRIAQASRLRAFLNTRILP